MLLKLLKYIKLKKNNKNYNNVITYNYNNIIIHEHDHGNIHKSNIILSDSLSSLMSLQSPYNTTDIARPIRQKISQVRKTGIKISLILVSGHSNIEGNEKADH